MEGGNFQYLQGLQGPSPSQSIHLLPAVREAASPLPPRVPRGPPVPESDRKGNSGSTSPSLVTVTLGEASTCSKMTLWTDNWERGF